MNGRRLVMTMFFVALILVTWDEINRMHQSMVSARQAQQEKKQLPQIPGLPHPSRFWMAAILFTMLGVMATVDALANMAGAIAVGLDIAIYMNLASQKSGSPSANTQQGLKNSGQALGIPPPPGVG